MLGPASIKNTTKSGNVILNAKIVRGVAHPPGEPDTYNGLKLTQKEIFEKYENLPGTLVYDNHDLSRPIGKVMSVSIGDDGELLMDALISKDYPHSEEVIERVLSGDYRGMSLGMDHKVNMDTGFVHESNIHELSLCPDGDMPGTLIRTVANDQHGIDKPFQTRWFDIGANASSVSAHEVNQMDVAVSNAFGWLNRDTGRISSSAGAGVEERKNDIDNSNNLMNKMTESAPYQSGIFSSEKAAVPFVNNNNKERIEDMSESSTLAAPATTTTTTAPPESAFATAPAAKGNSAGKFNPPNSLFYSTVQHHNTAKETSYKDDGDGARIRPPTDHDPYYRNALGQFASKPENKTNTSSGQQQQQTGSIASAMANAVRGAGLMPSSQTAPADGAGSSPSQHQDASATGQTAPTSNPASVDGGESADAASSQSSGSAKRVAISQDDYSQLLDMKSKYEEMEKKQKEIEQQNVETQKRIKEWESIGATLGGSSDLEASKKVLDELKAREIGKFLEKVDEIMPELDQIHKDSEGASKQDIENIIYALKNYQINRNTLKDPKELAGARGLVEVVTKASRSYNTRFTEQEAKIKELQRRHAEYEKALTEEKKRNEELSKKNSLYSQSGSTLSGANSIEPTIIGNRQPAKEAADPFQSNNSKVRTTASSSSFTGKRKSTMSSVPFERPPGSQSGYTYKELLQNAGGVQNLRTTASAGDSGMSFDDYERKRAQETKRVKVAYNKETEVPIDVWPWDPSQGAYASLGENYVGNATFSWIENCIKSDRLVDMPAFMTTSKGDHLMDLNEAIRSKAIKRQEYWRS